MSRRTTGTPRGSSAAAVVLLSLGGATAAWWAARVVQGSRMLGSPGGLRLEDDGSDRLMA